MPLGQRAVAQTALLTGTESVSVVSHGPRTSPATAQPQRTPLAHRADGRYTPTAEPRGSEPLTATETATLANASLTGAYRMEVAGSTRSVPERAVADGAAGHRMSRDPILPAAR